MLSIASSLPWIATATAVSRNEEEIVFARTNGTKQSIVTRGHGLPHPLRGSQRQKIESLQGVEVDEAIHYIEFAMACHGA